MNTAPLKADQQAADRLLKAAVRRTRDVMSRASVSIIRDGCGNVIDKHLNYDRAYVQNVLTAAGESAALLLDERPAKKAAARKGAS